MRSARKSHPEWGYHAPTSGVLPAIRIALVATVIGAIGGAAVVVSLIERPGANEDNTSSIAAHALVTGAPVIPASPSSLKAATLAHGPGQPKPAPSVGLPAPPAASASTSSTGALWPKPDRIISPTPRAAVSAIPPRAEATAATGDVRADVAPAIAPVEGRHHVAAKRWRHRRPRRVFGEYSRPEYGSFGSMHNDW